MTNIAELPRFIMIQDCYRFLWITGFDNANTGLAIGLSRDMPGH